MNNIIPADAVRAHLHERDNHQHNADVHHLTMLFNTNIKDIQGTGIFLPLSNPVTGEPFVDSAIQEFEKMLNEKGYTEVEFMTGSIHNSFKITI